MEEEWRPVIGFEDRYEVSNLGNVRSIFRYKKILKPWYDKDGYSRVHLISKDGKRKHFSIHRLVAINFIHNPNNLPQVNHISGDKNDNCVNNLEWCSCKENIHHSIKNGLRKPHRKAWYLTHEY